jgi:hypothetical protein
MIFFHVGLHKTGTTFLQKAVFPRWRGVEYIAWPHLELFLRLDDSQTYLVSREGLSGQNWAHHDARERSLQKLAELFPDCRILISFRKQAGYINSSYNQYVQRGGTITFREYFELKQDGGVMKRQDFLYRPKIEAIERYFGHRPFVFLHEELITDLDSLLGDMERYIGGHAPARDQIPTKRYNESVGYYPAKLLRWLNGFNKSELNPKGKYNLGHPTLQRFGLTPAIICQKWLGFLPKRAFLTPAEIAEIDEFYSEDWEYVRRFARERRNGNGHDSAREPSPIP